MTAPVLDMNHPSDERLAAFIDGRVQDEQILEHLADCADCRDVMLAANEWNAAETPASVVPHRRAAGKFFWPLAAAAALAIVFFSTPLRYRVVGQPAEKLVSAAEALPVRMTPGRLTGDYRYIPEAPRTRGSGAPMLDDQQEAERAAAQLGVLEILVDNAEAVSPNRHTAGVGTLLTANGKDDYDAAVADLTAALAKARGRDRDIVANDLAAALLGRASFSGSDSDYKSALRLADDLWTRTKKPEALWNRATALQGLGKNAEAEAAWNEYLRIEKNPEWAGEAREHLDYVKEAIQSEKDAQLRRVP